MTCKQLFNYENVNRNILDIREPEFWKWINRTLEGVKQKPQYKNKEYKYIINCPHCLSMNVIDATIIQDKMKNMRTVGLNQYTKDKEKSYIEIIKKLEDEK